MGFKKISGNGDLLTFRRRREKLIPEVEKKAIISCVVLQISLHTLDLKRRGVMQQAFLTVGQAKLTVQTRNEVVTLIDDLVLGTRAFGNLVESAFDLLKKRLWAELLG